MEAPHLVRELTADQFGQWRRHPVTELVLDKWIDDFLLTLQDGVLASWLAGNLSLQVEQDSRGYIHALKHLQGMRLPDLQFFWNVPPEERADRPLRQENSTGYA